MGPHLFLRPESASYARMPHRLAAVETRIANRLAPQYLCRHHTKPHNAPPVARRPRLSPSHVADIRTFDHQPQRACPHAAKTKKHLVLNWLATIRDVLNHEPVRMAREIATPFTELGNDRWQSKGPAVPVGAECASDLPVVKNSATTTRRLEIQRALRARSDRHAMRRVFDVDGCGCRSKLPRSGNGEGKEAGDEMRKAISHACHVDIASSQNRNPLHTPAKGETANYREIPPR